MTPDPDFLLTSADQFEALYAAPSERAILKQIDRLDEHCRSFMAASPFLMLATAGRDGVDCSPRGDRPGFVEAADDKTLLIPDRRGNNRIDSLRNLIDNPQIGLLFLVPGVNETLRINGEARISSDPALCARFETSGALPRTVVIVTVSEVFMQCPRALVRSELWNPGRHLKRSELPSFGTILAAHTGGAVEAASYDADHDATLKETLY